MILSIVTLCLLYIGADGQESPKVVPFTSLVKPVIGSKTSFACQSLTGSPPLHVSWFKDGNELTDSSTIRIRTNEDSSMLIIDSIKSSHSGNYTCKISNRFGYDSFTAQLLVEGSPNWLEKPADTKSNLGNTITLNCRAVGYPNPKVEWKRFQDSSWYIISANEGFKYDFNQSNDKLTIKNVTRSDNGRYGCSISNGIKPDLWSEFDVSIQGIADCFAIIDFHFVLWPRKSKSEFTHSSY
ncbi:cell adhesion molecule DSCAML1-like [Panonychus citri]|uniref:cell adhesion molecule DSCAML1-like n=1 Tax=Panonychus citri TaxID=50023 RepID=UPI0023077BB7|nr:cell adhesion molecule DSCAML1-like [Panonychus citri]